MYRMLTLALLLLLSTGALQAEVLGPCGTPDAKKPAAPAAAVSAAAPAGAAVVSRIPLPGEQAPNFELAALFPNQEVKKVKLSDYDGKWRVVCFYPADFTFV